MPTLTADACHRVATAVTDPGWWLSQWDRRRLWRSVVNAERSVRHAKAAGVPTGDLASVTRQLRKAAAVVDAGLRSGRPSRDLQRQANELASAADDVSRAAAAAVASDATPLTERALEAVSLELAALRR